MQYAKSTLQTVNALARKEEYAPSTKTIASFGFRVANFKMRRRKENWLRNLPRVAKPAGIAGDFVIVVIILPFACEERGGGGEGVVGAVRRGRMDVAKSYLRGRYAVLHHPRDPRTTAANNLKPAISTHPNITLSQPHHPQEYTQAVEQVAT